MKKAFTLAEVLITLMIIGVIASLTIPNLLQRYQEQATVNKVKKFYSTLTNAYQIASKEYGDYSEWDLQKGSGNSAIKIYEILFENKFKISKNCGLNNQGNCITNNTYKQLNGSNHSRTHGTETDFYKLVLHDGSSVFFRGPAFSTIAPDATIFIDVNGIKEPNQFGKDLFNFYFADNVLLPMGMPETNEPFDNYCAKKSSIGSGCAAWLVYKGNMDYLHCNDLTWNGKNKCSK